MVLGLSRTGRLVHRACYPLLRVANFVRELVVSILQGLYKNLWGATAGFAVALLSVVYTMSNLALRKAIREKLRQLGGATGAPALLLDVSTRSALVCDTQRPTAVLCCARPASSSCAGDRWFTHADLVGLPDPVQRYFRFALEEGTPLHRFTCVTVVRAHEAIRGHAPRALPGFQRGSAVHRRDISDCAPPRTDRRAAGRQ